jgi:hypothetical protein
MDRNSFLWTKWIVRTVESNFGDSFLSISTVTTYFNYKQGVKITLGVILIGVLNLIDFFPMKNLINFGIKNAFEIGFEYSLFGIAIVHYFTNRTELSKFLKYLFNREISEEEIKLNQKSKSNRFKSKFSNKSISELEMIINSDSFVPEAISAAKELIEEKKNP